MAKKVLTRKNAEALAKRDGGYFCHYCGTPVKLYSDMPDIDISIVNSDGEVVNTITTKNAEGFKTLSIDHKTPKAKGGSDDLDNLLLACFKCNAKKGKKDYSDFLKWLKG